MKREPDDPQLPQATRHKIDSSLHVSIKSLITNQQARILIGDAEQTINGLRQSSSVEVSDYITGALERILIITGPVDELAQTYGRCIRIMLGEEPDSKLPDEGFQFSLKIVLQHVYLLPLLRNNGQRLREIAECGAKIKACEFLLPLSSERAVTMTGTVTQISGALTQIAQSMIPLKEKADNSISKPYTPVTMSGRYGHPNNFKHIPADDTTKSPSNPYGIAPSASTKTEVPEIAEVKTGPVRNLKDKMTQQIFIPNDMVGAIIGKQGSKINEIRNLSGSHIKINEPDPSRPAERLITVEGTGEQNQLALYMLYQRLESEKRRL